MFSRTLFINTRKIFQRIFKNRLEIRAASYILESCDMVSIMKRTNDAGVEWQERVRRNQNPVVLLPRVDPRLLLMPLDADDGLFALDVVDNSWCCRMSSSHCLAAFAIAARFFSCK